MKFWGELPTETTAVMNSSEVMKYCDRCTFNVDEEVKLLLAEPWNRVHHTRFFAFCLKHYRRNSFRYWQQKWHLCWSRYSLPHNYSSSAERCDIIAEVASPPQLRCSLGAFINERGVWS